VHLNLQFREPLSGALPGIRATLEHPLPDDQAPMLRSGADADPFVLEAGPLTIVVAGHGAGPDAEETARAGGWPLVAEASSGARFGPNLVVSYRELLSDGGLYHGDFGDDVERVVLFGHPTLSREVPALLARDGVETIVVTGGGVPIDPGHAATRVAASVTVSDEAQRERDTPEGRAWLGSWVMTSRRLLDELQVDGPAPDIEASRSAVLKERGAFARAELAALRAPITRSALALAAWRATWPHDRLVLGASRLIREVDRVAPGKKIRVHANRGLAGIDGTVSTAIGIALASQGAVDRPDHGGITRVLLGDLTLLHDVGGLLIGAGETRPRIQLIVGNDGGGTIFDELEVAQTADPDAFARVMRTPATVDLAALAQAYGWSYTRVSTRSELDRALTSPDAAQSIVEVPL
jgi:2-succinyl-5-enolpyruvyl-6-hydroxy-3-cyclohexene-1-carboxylate synthase